MFYICKRNFDLYIYKGARFRIIPTIIRDCGDYYFSWLKYELILSFTLKNDLSKKKNIHYE